MNIEAQNILLKNEINILIDNILKQEDELNKYINITDNQALMSKISKNNIRINSLTNLIQKETKIAEEKIKILEDEIINFQQELVKLNEPKLKYNQKDYEQILIKEKLLLKTINLHENENNQIIENLKLLKEEKLMVSNELIDLMSLRENYEEIIKTRAKYIFKVRKKTPFIKKKEKDVDKNNDENKMEDIINLNLDENTNININQIKVEYYDILNITSITKLCNYIYKIVATNIVSNFSSLLIELNLKNIISLCVENVFNKYIKNNSNITSNKINNFIREISVNIVNYNLKISSLFVEPQFELILKCIFKLFSIEKSINDRLKFVNSDYSSNKTILKNKKSEIEKKLNDCNKQRNELQIEKNKIKNDCDLKKNYLNKIDEVKKVINLKEIKIKKLKEELNLTLSIYQRQIDGLNQENINMENKYKNSDFQYKIDNINQQIDFLFNGIKSKINGINDLNQKEELIKDFIKDINNCLESNNNINNNNYKYNLINIEDNIKINNNFNKEKEDMDTDENNEISENELLSSYNSANLSIQNPTKIYYKKMGKKNFKNRFISEDGKENENEFNNEKISVNNINLNSHHHHYLKLSECFQFNN